MTRADYAGRFDPGLRLEHFSRGRLARLAREWLLIGHLQDRVGMPLVLSQHTADEMAGVAIDEWMGASPIYSRRVQERLNFVGNDVATIFKNIKIDIGAPHHFLDFRFAVHDAQHGEFWLDHCGALMDAEPMGDEYVQRMCHDIEDPTFDATAAAIHPHAKIRPLHRPPRVPNDRTPHCHWTAVIDETTEPYTQHPNLDLVGRSRIATVAIDDPGADGEVGGLPDLSGDIDPNFELEDLGHRCLVLALQEVAVQIHLLSRAFLTCVAQRWGEAEAAEHAPGVFTGVAGIGAERLRDEFGLGSDTDSLAKVVQLHPVFWPRTYVPLHIDVLDRDTVRIGFGDGPAFAEGDTYSWFATFDNAEESHPALDAIGYAIDPAYGSHRVAARAGERHAFELRRGGEVRRQAGFVSLAKISTGATVTFIPRTEVQH